MGEINQETSRNPEKSEMYHISSAGLTGVQTK